MSSASATKDLHALRDRIQDEDHQIGINAWPGYHLHALCERIQDEDLRKGLTQEVERLGSCIADQATPGDNPLFTIAVAGSFSCGKSSFINSLLGDPIAPADAPPLTHCITRFIYGPKEHITDGAGLTISRKKYQKCVVDKKSHHASFVIAYPSDILKGFSLMDAPGFGSPDSAGSAAADVSRDNQLSMKAVQDADAVLFLVKITDGTLHNSSVLYINGVSSQLHDADNISKPMFFILTHADLKMQSERKAVQDKINAVIDAKEMKVTQVVIYSSCKEHQDESDKAYFAKRKQEVLGIIAHLADKKKAIHDQSRRRHHQRTTERLDEGIARMFEILKAQKKSLKKSVEVKKMAIRRRWMKASGLMVNAIFAMMFSKIAAIHCEIGSDFYDVRIDKGWIKDDHIISIKDNGNPLLRLTSSEEEALKDSCGDFLTLIGDEHILTAYNVTVASILSAWPSLKGSWESIADTMQEFTDNIKSFCIEHEQDQRQIVASEFADLADDVVRETINESQPVVDLAQLRLIGSCLHHGKTTGQWTTTKKETP